MSRTLTIRLTEDQAKWLEETSRKTGVPAGRIIRQQIEAARKQKGNQGFLRHAGELTGPRDLSTRKGFSHE